MTSQQSYTLTVACGCVVYVSCHPTTGVAHTRVIERRGSSCRNRHHDIGTRLWLWEVLPETVAQAQPEAPDAPARRGVAIPGSAAGTVAGSRRQLHQKT